jgi:hypothetical protein
MHQHDVGSDWRDQGLGIEMRSQERVKEPRCGESCIADVTSISR